MKIVSRRLLCLSLIVLCSCHQRSNERFSSWKVYNGTKEGAKYSSLSQIDTGNVQLLRPVWEYHAGDADTVFSSQIQCNPIIVDDVLYAVSPQLKLLALDAATGRAKWTFDPRRTGETLSAHALRGVSYWEEGADKRIFLQQALIYTW
ncbi:hypothetical protein MKQ70_00570 [Chitinophaga sedimenti]|uniref:hypothetical protein n=1 Tax=Chitinophaga sedimenti TaxID=2033606 RepID=UPI002003B429|nr:hypothetical protein [Chitinophaga sedimenti]MCK7553576.1 hypothetical protein [Chitinophaga sedimenti]